MLGQYVAANGQPGYTGARCCCRALRTRAAGLLLALLVPRGCCYPVRRHRPAGHPPRPASPPRSLAPPACSLPATRQTTPRCQPGPGPPPLPPSRSTATTTGARRAGAACGEGLRHAAVALFEGAYSCVMRPPFPPADQPSTQLGGRAVCAQGGQGAERPQGGDPGADAGHPPLSVWQGARRGDAQRGGRAGAGSGWVQRGPASAWRRARWRLRRRLRPASRRSPAHRSADPARRPRPSPAPPSSLPAAGGAPAAGRGNLPQAHRQAPG